VHRSLVITWHAEEFIARERGAKWYWSVGVIGLLAAFLAFYFDNILFALLLLVGTGVVLLYSKRPPMMVQYSISIHGVRIGSHLFPFENLDSFWIHEHEETPLIMLQTSSFLTPMLSLPLVGVEPSTVRDFLNHFIKEKKHEIPLSEHISRALGF